MAEQGSERPASIPADAWWDDGDQEWVLGPKDDNDELHGMVQFWRGDGTLCCRSPYEHGQPHGACVRFHESGEVSQRCTYVGGKLHGTRSWFSIDGPTTENTRPPGVSDLVRHSQMDYDMDDVTSVRHFDAEERRVGADGVPFPGLPAGLPADAYWDEQQTLWKIGRANSDAEKIGLWQVWTPAGALLERCEYDDDARHGEARLAFEPDVYAVPDAVAMHGRYQAGVRVGEWTFVDRDAQTLATFDYGDAVGDDVSLEFFDSDDRTAAAWEDLAGQYRGARHFGLALCASARAAASRGDVVALESALAQFAAPMTVAGGEAAIEELESVSDLIEGLVAGADAAAVYRKMAVYLDQQDCSRAALAFVNVALALAPDRADYHFTRALIHMSLGDVDAARSDAKRIPDQGQRGFIGDYARILFPVFDFWPRREKPHTHYEGLPDAPSRSLDEIRTLIGKYATRLQGVRERLLADPGPAVAPDVPWMVPDLSALLPDGPVGLVIDRFEIPDPDEPDEPYVIDIDETLDVDDHEVPTLMRMARDDWHALAWLCWSCGLDRIALPTAINAPSDFGQAAGMAPARLWRCRDKFHMGGIGARMQGIPGFIWEGIDIDDLADSLTRMAASEYEEMQAMVYWLTDDDVRSPWQDNLRGS